VKRLGFAAALGLSLAAGCTCMSRTVPAEATGTGGGSAGDPTSGGSQTAGPFPDLPGNCHPERYGDCDPWCQDCPEGQKCAPWSSDGGPIWDAARCVPLAPAPKGVGKPCTAVGSGTSGVDDCEKRAMCWNVDPETLEGTCIGLCRGTADAPACPRQHSCVVLSGGVPMVCSPWCTPWPFPPWEEGDVACGPPGMACHLRFYGSELVWEFPVSPMEWGLGCLPDASYPDVTQGVTCEAGAYCYHGYTCVPSSLVPCNDPDADACCTAWCDLMAPDCPAGTACKPVFEDGFDLSPVFDNLGLCLGL